jgi:hypothetical protein
MRWRVMIRLLRRGRGRRRALCADARRHIARTGAPPRQTAADGGYASRANLAAAKARRDRARRHAGCHRHHGNATITRGKRLRRRD